jgi:hypothetical protein
MRGLWNSTYDACETVHIQYVYQEASAAQIKLKELQERVGHLMIVIVDNVTLEYEEGGEVVVKAVGGIEKDVKGLLRCAPYLLTRVDS